MNYPQQSPYPPLPGSIPPQPQAPAPVPVPQPQPPYQMQPVQQPPLYPQYPPPPQPLQAPGQPRFQPDPQAQLQPPAAPPPPGPPAPISDGIDSTQVTRVRPQEFTVHFLIDDQAQGLKLVAMNLESLLAELSVLSAINMPRVQAWNVYDAAGRLVAAADMVQFATYVAERTTLRLTPADKSAAGWRAMPIVTQTAPDFQAVRDQAKKDGRLPQ